MIANLRNYEPETIEFVVPDSIREKFPPVLFQGSTAHPIIIGGMHKS